MDFAWRGLEKSDQARFFFEKFLAWSLAGEPWRNLTKSISIFLPGLGLQKSHQDPCQIVFLTPVHQVCKKKIQKNCFTFFLGLKKKSCKLFFKNKTRIFFLPQKNGWNFFWKKKSFKLFLLLQKTKGARFFFCQPLG